MAILPATDRLAGLVGNHTLFGRGLAAYVPAERTQALLSTRRSRVIAGLNGVEECVRFDPCPDLDRDVFRRVHVSMLRDSCDHRRIRGCPE
jgi:hypothetical protein